MDNIQVEILLATFNGDKYLKTQLESIFCQTHDNFKITIRDDGSDDGTLSIIRRYKESHKNRITLITDNKKRLGATLSFAELLKHASCEYIMLSDQDDFWMPDKIERTLGKMEEMEKQYRGLPLLVCTDLKEVNNNLDIISESFMKAQKLYPSTIINDPIKLLALNVVAGCTVMINKLALQYVLPIPAGNIVHDKWMAINIAQYGKIEFLNETLILYRQHNSNAVGSNMVGFRYFLNKLGRPFHQLNIYKDLIVNLNFKVNVFKFIYYKIYYTLKRL